MRSISSIATAEGFHLSENPGCRDLNAEQNGSAIHLDGGCSRRFRLISRNQPVRLTAKMMLQRIFFFLLLVSGVAACTASPDIRDDPVETGEVEAGPTLYIIDESMNGRIQHRVVDAVNGVRQTNFLPEVALSPTLNAAAKTHARDMFIQNRPWHFGSDGSSPLDRTDRVQYRGLLVGENIAETYESELLVLGAWLERADTRETILDPRAARIGIGWHQQENGKIWWVLLVGT